MNSDDRSSHSFLVRVWSEQREMPGDPPIWRGSIDDVNGGPRVYFVSLPEMVDFMRTRAGMMHPKRQGRCGARRKRQT